MEHAAAVKSRSQVTTLQPADRSYLPLSVAAAVEVVVLDSDVSKTLLVPGKRRSSTPAAVARLGKNERSIVMLLRSYPGIKCQDDAVLLFTSQCTS